MNNAAADINASSGGSMMDELGRREQLSALADGQLEGEELSDALAWASQDQGLATWELYHMVGDVLRSSDLAKPSDSAFLARLRVELASETVSRPAVPAAQPVVGVVATAGQTEAANASVFRWKMVAGFASLAAVAAIGWTSLVSLQEGGTPGAAGQLAAAPDRSAPVVAVADSDGQQVMLRDPRLDELLAAHKQFGSTSALQMPAGFLRNATFETPGR